MARERFNEQLGDLNTELIQMGGLCESAIDTCVEALVNGDEALVAEVSRREREIDEKESEITALCMKMLLHQQPVASDLRQISAALKMVTDLERIGDQADDIGEMISYTTAHKVDEYSLIQKMGLATKRMVREAIDAFVKQDALVTPGAFFGTSMIERAIPVQRAYNAVKNRKHEFLSRLCCGVLAVEDGAVDTDLLESDGLRPGSVIVYRQGSQAPRMLDQGGVPSAFAAEEAKLEEEFNVITGISDIMRSSAVPSQANSGTAIQLLIEQDDSRLAITSDMIRAAVREVSRMVLRLYKQFASGERLTRCVGEDGKVELIRWKGSDIGECDVVYDTVAESALSRSGRQSRLLELLRIGLLNDEDGSLGVSTRHKLLAAFGYGSWETAEELRSLHEEKADGENLRMEKGENVDADEIDEHDLHIRSHVRYMLSAEFDKAAKHDRRLKERMLAHIRGHRAMKALTAEANGENGQNGQTGA